MPIKIYKIVAFASIVFLLSGCEDYPVYSSFMTKEHSAKLSCIKIASFDPKLTSRLTKDFSSLTKQKECSYSLTGYIHHVDACTNPQVKSLGVDFNGYVRLKVLDGDKLLYRIQSDFKNDEVSALKRVIKTMKKELF